MVSASAQAKANVTHLASSSSSHAVGLVAQALLGVVARRGVGQTWTTVPRKSPGQRPLLNDVTALGAVPAEGPL